MSRSRLLRVVAATTVAFLATAVPAFAHTNVSPGQVDPDAEVTLAFRAPPEREAVNQSLRVLIPEQFVPGECAAPTTWTCDFDAETHAPHTMVTWTAPDPNVLTAVMFEVTVTAPSADDAGLYMFRALQDYSDGHTAPWAFEPGSNKPAPTVQVGDDQTLRNGPGSANEPCFGPAEDPASGEPGPEQAPCPSTASADDTSTDDTTSGADADDTADTSDTTDNDSTTTSGATSADAAPAAESAQLANTGGGAALLALGLLGAVSTLRRRS